MEMFVKQWMDEHPDMVPVVKQSKAEVVWKAMELGYVIGLSFGGIDFVKGYAVETALMWEEKGAIDIPDPEFTVVAYDDDEHPFELCGDYADKEVALKAVKQLKKLDRSRQYGVEPLVRVVDGGDL